MSSASAQGTGWALPGARKPDWAYGAIIYEKAKNPADRPFMTAIVNKLTGDVEAAKILGYAPGLLENLPGYQPDGEVDKTSLSGFDGIVFEGSYLQGDVRRYIAQLTV
nr:LpqN/LpqT family lipoprotein [Actinomycetes bacterium]